MHRVTSGRPVIPSNVLYTARSFSTPPPRKPLAKWGDVVIPSREEISERKAKVQTDISYLKFENANSLAARLARPTIDITLARQQAEQKQKEEQAQSLSGNEKAAGIISPRNNRTIVLKSPKLATPNPNRAFSVEDIITKSNVQEQAGVPGEGEEASQTPVDAGQLEDVEVSTYEYSDYQMRDILIANRRESRLLREAARRNKKEKQEEELAKREREKEERWMKKTQALQREPPETQREAPVNTSGLDLATRAAEILKRAAASTQKRREERLQREVEKRWMKKTQALQREPPETQREAPVNTSGLDLATRAAEILKQAAASTQKRREERLQREVDSATVSRKQKRSSSRSNSKRIYEQTMDEDMEVEMIERVSSGNNGPEFVGPEPVSTTLFELYQPAAEAFATVAQLQAGHIQKGDYSAYVPSSLAPFSTPPDVLGAPRLAELTLSHQRDVSITSRKHAVHLVASSLKPATRSLQKRV